MIEFRVGWVEIEARWVVNAYVGGVYHSMEYFPDVEEMSEYLDIFVKNHPEET